ncbi:MAG: hypothetical protein RLZZ597_1400, partial [Cyanobacteriota bacterium]|jgi:hypothetical protein
VELLSRGGIGAGHKITSPKRHLFNDSLFHNNSIDGPPELRHPWALLDKRMN